MGSAQQFGKSGYATLASEQARRLTVEDQRNVSGFTLLRVSKADASILSSVVQLEIPNNQSGEVIATGTFLDRGKQRLVASKLRIHHSKLGELRSEATIANDSETLLEIAGLAPLDNGQTGMWMRADKRDCFAQRKRHTVAQVLHGAVSCSDHHSRAVAFQSLEPWPLNGLNSDAEAAQEEKQPKRAANAVRCAHGQRSWNCSVCFISAKRHLSCSSNCVYIFAKRAYAIAVSGFIIVRLVCILVLACVQVLVSVLSQLCVCACQC